MTSSRSLLVLRPVKQACSIRPSLVTTRPLICSDCQHRQSIISVSSFSISRRNRDARSLSTTSTLYKKSSASSKSSKQSPSVKPPKKNEHIPDNAATQERDGEIDPYDNTELEAGIDSAIARLKDVLAKTRDAGRVTSEMIEALPVDLNIKHPDQRGGKGKGEAPHHEKVNVGEIASVVPKGGRTMQVFAAEENHVKSLLSAMQASEYSLTPEVDQNNPLLIIVPVPPATAETRQQAAAEAKKVFDKASLDVRNARGDAQKRHRKMELGKLVIRDELRKAHKLMEDVAKKGQDEAKRVYEAALKALQQ